MQRLYPSNSFVEPRLVPGNRIAIGEAPGQEESLEGEPFVGGSGRILRGTKVRDPRTGAERRYGGLYGEAGIKDSEISYINTIQCRPPDNVYPTDSKAKYISREDGNATVKHCLQRHVLPVLRSRTWARIDLIGSKALRFLGEKYEGVEGWRGSPISIPALGDGREIAMATIHPAALMRDQSLMVAVVNDLKKSLIQPPENYILKPDVEQLTTLRAHASNADHLTFDIETNYPRSRDITMVGFTTKPYHAAVVSWKEQYLNELKRLLGTAETLVGHNVLQFDIPYLEEYGITFNSRATVYDTMLMHALFQPGSPHDLTFVGSIFTSKPTWEFEKKSSGMELYCARDVDVTEQAFHQLRALLRLHGLERLYHYVQVPLAKICKLMSVTGIAVDATRIERVRERILTEMGELELRLPEDLRSRTEEYTKRVAAPPGTLSELKYGKSGKPLKQKEIKTLPQKATRTIVPWRSPDKIATYLYETCNLPTERDLKTDAITTGKIALAKITRRLQSGAYKPTDAEKVHQAVKAVTRLRQLDELEGNFCQEEYLHLKRIHPHFNVHVAESGRLSSSGPNLQNVPAAARHIYVPSHTGWKLIEVDYSGIENRITAYLADDTERLLRFDSRPGFSEHKYATSLFYDIPYDDVVKDNDRNAPYGRCKAIVHGTDRGEGARKIALLNDLPESEIKPLHNKWKAAIPKTIQWQKRIAEQCAKDGYLTNPFGRKWWGWGSRMYTQAISFMPQSTAADVIFRAMIGMMYKRINWPLEKVAEVVGIYEALPKPAALLLQVHDALVLEAPEDMVEDVVRILKKVMEQSWPELGGLVLPISIAVGDSWGELE